MRLHLQSRSRRALFLAGVSMVAMAASSGAMARPFGMTSNAPSATAAASSAAQDAAQQALKAAQSTQESLAQATKAIQALQAVQSAARALARNAPSSVPNGLVTGGLVPDSGLKSPGVANPVTTWVGANTPTQTTSNGQTTVNIEQTQQNALLNWQTFNVGRSTTVNFNQKGNANWSALNRIASNTAPSQIQGAIKADGAVYLINQNGIVFAGSSQINVHTLIASSLDLPGKLSSNNYQGYLQSGLFSLLGDVPTSASVTGSGAAIFNQGSGGKITVQSGAVISTTDKLSANGDGGYVALLADGGVSNAGSIFTKNGQIIMAADKSVTLVTPQSTWVGAKTAMQVLAGGGIVTNEADGLLVSNAGAVTLAGGTVNQLGSIVATTGTTRTGSIMLSTLCPQDNCAAGGNGNIVLGASSVTTILPDVTSGTLPTATMNSSGTFNGSATAAPYFEAVLQPKIDILALRSVDVQGSSDGTSGAQIKAPSAALTINAGTGTTANTAGAVLLEKGSTIDLSGLAGVTLPMSVNQLVITITAAEVADHPLAKSLIGKTVLVDARVGSPILNIDGYIGLIPQGIEQILTVGGSFKTSATNVIQQPGATINVSAGYVRYTGGLIATSRVRGADGRIYDIGHADPSIAYVGLASGFTVEHKVNGLVDQRLTEVYLGPLGGSGGLSVHDEVGYITGANAGSVSVAAINPIVNDIIGNVTAGDRQRAGLDKMPSGASLSLIFAKPGDATTFNPHHVVLQSQADAGPDPYGLGGLTFANASSWSPVLADGVFSIFSDVLSNASLGSVSIKGAHQLDVATGATLSVRPGGSITLDGVGTIDGTLSAPAGTISLTGYTYASGTPQLPSTPALVIGSHAVLDVRGRWVNDTGLLPDQIEGSAFVNGGSISIGTVAASNTGIGTNVFVDVTQSIVLAAGSVIDVSGGGYVDTTGKLKTGSDGLPVGKGGSLTLATYVGGFPGRIPTPGDVGSPPYNILPQGTNPDGTVNHPDQANVLFGGDIYAGGFAGGGTLTLQVPTLVIDGKTTDVTSYVSSATAQALAATPATNFTVSDAKAGQTVLPPSFFTSGGFSQYTLVDISGGTTVTAGTQLALQQPTLVAGGREAQIPTGARVRDFASVGLLPEGLRKPVSLTLNSLGSTILIDSGAAIVADPQATVSLVGNSTVRGSIVAHAGAINVLGENTRIESGATLDVSGAFVRDARVVTYSTGTVFDGGTITLAGLSTGATVVVQPGAQFNLQGAAVTADSGLIQVAQGGFPGGVSGQAAWSTGGTLQLAARNIYFAGTVNAAGGAPQAAGGRLTIGAVAIPSSLAAYVPSSTAVLPQPATLVIEPAGLVAANLPAAGGTTTAGAFIGADTLSNSGFDSVTLSAGTAIAFGGSVDVKIPGALTLIAGDSGNIVLLPASAGLLPSGVQLNNAANNFGLGSCGTDCILSIGGTTVNLDAGYVRLVGRTTPGAGFVPPTIGDGKLNVTAKWIDLQGVIGLDNVVTANLVSAAAIRLLPDTYGSITGNSSDGRSTFGGALFAPGNLTLQAAEIYPVSNTDFLLISTGTLASASTVTIAQNGTPSAPLSAGGGIALSAKTIVQNGTLWAPFGSIVLGMREASQIPAAISLFLPVLSGVYTGPFTPTQDVTLGANSLTSVSGAGLVIPDGYTIDGTTWYQGTPSSGTGLPPVLTAPPSKSISLFGANVKTLPGAQLDLNGGGDIYATEFVAGTGGSRNVLTSYQQDPATGAVTPQYSDGRQVYALVPTYQGAVAAYDPNFADRPYYSGVAPRAGGGSSVAYPNAIAPGQSVTIGPGSGIPAGTYTLLPGMYATLPGAYRVVQVANNANPNASVSFTGPDGSQYVSGTLGNALTGARSSQSAVFQLQSQSVWSQYSRIDITSGTRFFRNQAIAAGKAPPPLPIDGGVLVLGAIDRLDLAGTNRFAPGVSALAPELTGGGGQVQIGGGTSVLIAERDGGGNLPTRNGYLVLDADQISNLQASSVLIGGTAQVVNGVQNITATALDLEIASGAVLSAPELLLVSKAGGRGVVVDDGSVIAALGAVPPGTSRDITFGANPVAQFNSDGTLKGYSAGISGDGSLLRVSNGSTVNVTRFFVPGQYTGPGTPPAGTTAQGVFSIGAGARIDGGNALTLDTSGNGALASDVSLKAKNYDIAGSVINIGGGSSGVTLNAKVLANFNDAVSVRLRSASVINLFDAGGLQVGDSGHAIGTLIFDSAGLYGQGGSTTVNATNISLANSRGVTGTSTGIAGAGGTLTLNATGTVTEDVGSKNLRGFGQVNVNAGQAIAFSGNGKLDAGTANLTLSAPVMLVNAGATQSVGTLGTVNLVTGAGTAPATVATNIGGALAVTAASIADNAVIRALSGNVSLTATAGDVVLGAGAVVDASGSRIAILDVTQDAPGGTIRLTSTAGNVVINPGATVSVAAAGNGFAGSLSILAAKQVTLGGTLDGHAAFQGLGGNFALQAGSLNPSSSLPFGLFTGSFAVRLGVGDIRIEAGQTLVSNKVLLVANTGSVVVNGTIDASGSSSQIALYGASGVAIGGNAVLDASYRAYDPRDPRYGNGTSALVQKGGTITLGTTGTPDGTLNADYGYQNVTTSGAITVADGAIFNVSGGPGGANIDNTGGSVSIRAPILSDGSVNVDFKGTVVTNADSRGNPSGSGVVLNAYAVWSTTDGCSLIPGGCGAVTTVAAYNALTPDQQKQLQQHFDGIIDPAGFFDATLTNGKPTQIIFANNGLYPNSTATDPAAGAYLPHVTFYQSTLQSFVNNPFDMAAVAASFADAKLRIAGSSAPAAPLPASMLHLRPEIDLINPSTTINNGNITVASNWNLGAGTLDTSGHVSLAYRTQNGGEPGTLSLLARNNVNINASITDGFFVNYNPGQGAPDAASLYAGEVNSSLYAAYLAMFSGGVLQYDSDGTTSWIASAGFTWADLGLNAPPAKSAPSAEFFGLTQEQYDALNLQFTLKQPDVISGNANVIDQYNRYYAQYLTLFRAYEQELVSLNMINPAVAPGPGGIILSYADYAAFMPVAGSLQLDPSTIVIPSAPTTAGQYYNLQAGLGTITFDSINGVASTAATDYATQWAAYFYNVINLNLYNYTGNTLRGTVTAPTLANTPGAEYNASVVAAIAVTPPAPPPAYSILQPGYVSSANPPHPADTIANNPTVYSVPGAGSINVYNTTSASQLMSAAVSGKGSFSYDVVAGAVFTAANAPSVDPNAVIPPSSLSPTVTGNVTIDGHTSYPNTQRGAPTINIPTLVRTGTGSITIAAAGNVEFLDQVTPGAIYTAGAAVATPSDFNAPALPAAYTNAPNGLVSTPAWGVGGGAVTVTVGGSIIGIEMPTDDASGSQTNVPNGPTGQMWSDWYIHYGRSNGSATPFAACAAAGSVACQTAAWINYATFFQGFGALGGGDITLSAGADIIDVGASLPETLVVSGGFTAANPPKATYYGGGNLSVTAGGDLLSSNFLVGRGTGRIQVGGVVQATTSNPVNQGKPTLGITTNNSNQVVRSYALPLLLAVQDGFITLNARGSVTLGNVYDPASLPLGAATHTPATSLPGVNGANSIWSNPFTSYGPGSGIALTSVTGDVSALTIAPTASAGLFVHGASPPSSVVQSTTIGVMLPASFELAALSGDMSINDTGVNGIGHANLLPYPTQAGDDTGTIRLVAAGSIDLGAGLVMPDLSTNTTQYVGNALNLLDLANYISPLGVPLPVLTLALHANDPDPVVIAAGRDIDATGTGLDSAAVLTLIKPANIAAGNNIYAARDFAGNPATAGSGAQRSSLRFVGQNNNPGDITSIVAGNDWVGGSYALYGPGTFVLQAGHDLGPFTPSVLAPPTSGIATLGNGSAIGATFGGLLAAKPYLPSQGAEIDVLFGVKPGIDYAAAITQYIDPAHAGIGGIDLLAGVASALGQPRDQAWVTFQGLSPARQRLLVNRAFLDFIMQVGRDFKNAASPYFGQYARAYTVISTLFPAGSGYTDNSLSVDGNAAPKIATGNFNIAASVLETQMGGDINILGPGGGVTVGHTALDTLQPNQQGILTLAGGSIRVFANDSILLNQSRIMTQQGGDIGLFSANGDINAGAGPKTYVSSPAVSEICGVDGYCYVNPQGLVTGAGVAALVTLPGQDPTKSNVTLVAPRGTIDLGSAGIRGNDIFIVAPVVLNAYNAQSTGTVTGLAPPPAIPTSLTSAANTTAATQQAGQPGAAKPNEQPSVIIVEVVGYGGSGGGIDSDEDERRKRGQQ